MAPNANVPPGPSLSTPLQVHIEKKKDTRDELQNGDKAQAPPPSTYPGIWKYPKNRDVEFRMPDDWLKCKREDDDLEGRYWRVHDKIYDLSPFINHPGGYEWLAMSKGTDITEAFEASHVKNVSVVEKTLEKFYVKDATTPRISPFTLKQDGFYMTLKRRIEPIMKKVGTGPTKTLLLMEDSLILSFMFFAVLSALFDSIILSLISGSFLAFSTIGAHNFIHLKENWRRYYLDLSFLSSYEWRITHAFSHHMYPNTLLDFELSLYPTYQFLPNRPKPWYQRHFSIFYSHLVYASAFWVDLSKRIYHIVKGQQKIRLENLLPFWELLCLLWIQDNPWVAVRTWAMVQTTASFVMITIGATASHHHTTCFHDGDEPLQDPDFGIGQLDATKDRAENFFNNLFVTLITFGHHPLHHLFPTVCHSKLPYLREVFEQTVREFKLDYPGIPQMELYLTCYQQLARTEAFKRKKCE